MTELYAVPVGPNLGPLYVKQKVRDHYPPEQGETCSLTDRVFQDKSSHQKLDFKPHPSLPPETRLTDYAYVNPCPVQALPDKILIVSEYRKMIREHVERRVLFFFQQLIVCHKTKLHFESVGAKDQGNSAEAISMKVKGKMQKYAVRQAAHSSGNPCLVAYDNAQWKDYQSGVITKPQGFVFLKDTDYYRTVNATMNMPKWINDADREIDEKTVHSQLREKGEIIINRNAQGLITPDEGMKEYLQEALSEVRAARQRLKKGKTPEVYAVLSYYEQYLTKFEGIIANDPKYLENFLNLKLGEATQDERAKRVILKMRYAAIRNCQLNQSAIVQKVQAVRKEIFTQLKAANGNRKPNNFDAAFKAVVVEQARTKENRHRLEKLLNFSPYNYEAQLTGPSKSKYLATKASVISKKTKIDFLVRDILEDMRKLRTQEMYDRAQTIKELRGMKHWTQVKLGSEIRQNFPHAAASQSTISRIENRNKLVTEQIAKEFSRVFGVDPGLFMPHFYYE